jgi:hypothetical protein
VPPSIVRSMVRFDREADLSICLPNQFISRMAIFLWELQGAVKAVAVRAEAARRRRLSDSKCCIQRDFAADTDLICGDLALEEIGKLLYVLQIEK